MPNRLNYTPFSIYVKAVFNLTHINNSTIPINQDVWHKLLILWNMYALKWWTWSQCIRTLSVLHFEVTILYTSNQPLYQEISTKSSQLYELGLSLSTIAKKLNVDEKTVSKAIRWAKES